MSASQIHFARLSESERDRAIKYLIDHHFSIVLRLREYSGKSVTAKINYYLQEFDKVVFTFEETEFDYDQKNVLVYFSIKGVSFFGTAKVSISENGPEGILTLGKEFFLCEKRSSFRLKTDTNHKVICFIAQEEIGGDDLNPSFKVKDISTGGLSFIIEKIKRGCFIKDKMIHSMEVVFDGFSLIIPRAKVLNIAPYHPPSEGEASQFKVNIQFFDVPAHVDNKLGGLINKYMKKDDVIEAFKKFLT